MLAIKPSSQKAESCAPNILPCQIKYDGPVNAHQRFWKPETDTENTQTSYFRGRKLKGKTLKLPAGFSGSVLQTTDRTLPKPQQPVSAQNEEEDEDEVNEEVKILEEVATFDAVTLWGHDTVPAETENAYSKGLQEWIALAEAMNSPGDATTGNTS